MYPNGNVSDSCFSRKKTPKDEWAEVVDKVEAAILLSLANKVLAEAVDKQEEINEHRRQLKLVALTSFSRKDSTG